MKFFHKRWVALIICAVMIVAAFTISDRKQGKDIYDPEDISSAEDWGEENYASYERYVSDEAELFFNGTERTLAEYNASFDYSYGSICGIATVSELDGQTIADAAYDAAEQLGLGSRDYLLLLDESASDWYFVYGEDASRYVDHKLEILVTGAMDTVFRSPDKSILDMFDDLEDWYDASVPYASSDYSRTDDASSEDGSGFIVLLIVFIIIIVMFSPARRVRRRRAGGWGPVIIGGKGPHVHVRHAPPPIHRSGPKTTTNHKHGSGGFGGGNRGNFGKGGGFGGSSRGGGFGGRR